MHWARRLPGGAEEGVKMSLPEWASLGASVATIVGFPAAVAGIVLGMVQYHRDRTLRCAEHFARIRSSCVATGPLSEIFHLLDSDDDTDNVHLGAHAPKDKRELLCFFEEVALLLKAKLIKPELAYYMFG